MTDTVPLGVLKAAFESLTRQMAVDLRRSAFSSIVREARDFSVAVTDARGAVVAQAECIPIMTAGISLALQRALTEIDPDELTADDAIVMNDPYKGGQHLQDIYLFQPIFVGVQLVAFAATTAHHVDIGGAFAGLSADATEIYQEGLRLPVAKFSVSRDWAPTGFVRRIIENNVRVPEMVIGDLEAQFAANATAARGLNEIAARYSLSETLSAMSELQEYGQARFENAIREIPDGVYIATETMDGTPWGHEELLIRAAVTVDDAHITVDLTGSAEQILGNANCPLASTVSAVQSAIRCMLNDQTIPFNEGCNKPITVIAEYGSILNPRAPAAVRARLTPASRVFNAVVRAIGQALPDRAVATGFDTTTAFAISHLAAKTGQYQVVMEILGGGWGACQSHDGADALDNPISNCANSPVESLETDYNHFLITEYSLNKGSSGEGIHSGGVGIRRVYESLRDGVMVSGYADRHQIGAEGLAGGGSGGTGSFSIRRAAGGEQKLSCVFSESLDRGDSISIVTGGGGGVGTDTA
jgi:N-methylhydantoinase B